MKIGIFLLLITVIQSFAVESYSQKTLINLNMKQATIEDVLTQIENQSEFFFLYSPKIINVKKEVSISVEDKAISEILPQLFAGTDVNYLVIDRQIVLSNNPIDKYITTQPQPQLSGTVTDENGDPIIGATVTVKGTTIGTITDVNGRYSLSNVPEDGVLVFSFVGMKTQEIEVGNMTSINVIMAIDAIGLEEVVAIGYGTQRKSDLTGAVASVSENQLQSRPVSTFEDALKGRISGVQIRQTGGDLTGRFSINIRGVNSVTGSNSPLVVVDGVPLFSGSLSTINPRDIISIDILKDASSTAIYGARAANGVIMVTTVKGEKGKVQFTVDSDYGVEQLTNRYDVLSTEMQRQLFVEAFKNSNRNTAVYDDPSHPAWQIDTDWQDLGTRIGIRQEYNIGFRGGTDKTNFAGSASYLDRQGTLLESDFKVWRARINVDSEVNEWLKFSTNLTASHQKQNLAVHDVWGSLGGYRQLVRGHTYFEAYDEAGNLTGPQTVAAPYFGDNRNPLVLLTLPTRESDASRILGNVRLEALLYKGLTLAGNLGSDILVGNGYTFMPVYDITAMDYNPEGIVTVGSNQQINWVSDLTLDYERRIDNHDFKLLAGLSAQQFILKNNNTIGRGTIDNNLNQLDNQTSFVASGSDVSEGLASSFVRLNYNFANKYLVTGTLRRDGSSKFGPDNRYGLFPSGAVAWRITEEDFIQSGGFLHDLKLRVSYGLTGNQNIPNFAFVTRARNAPYVMGNNVIVGNAPMNMGNPELKWEATAQFNAGIDISLLGGRIYASVDYYDKYSRDLLISQPVPLTAGVTQNPVVNIGSVKNTGIELSLNTVNLKGELSWLTNFNISFNKNEVIDIGANSLGEPLELPGTNIPLSNIPVNLTRAGYPVGAFYMYDYIGVWQIGEEEEAAYWSNAVPGDPRYADLNGNNRLDAGDRSYVGNPHPKFFGGLNNTLSYKRFSLSILAEFAGGYQIFHSMRNFFSRGVPFTQNLAEVEGWWTPDNPSNTIPRPSQGGNTTTLVTMASNRFLEDGDYLRIKNVRLSYDIPSLFGGQFIQAARLTLSGTNLITFTKYTGLDPESSSTTDLLSIGIDHTPYPVTRLISFAVRLTF